MPTTMEAVPYQTVELGPRRRAEHIVREGITVGLIGAVVAMLLFLVVDVAAGVPLRTPAILGSALSALVYFHHRRLRQFPTAAE
jgi:hypothetical protein